MVYRSRKITRARQNNNWIQILFQITYLPATHYLMKHSNVATIQEIESKREIKINITFFHIEKASLKNVFKIVKFDKI